MTINKNKCEQITCHRQVEGVHVSSILNEGIRTILNLFFFFYEKISHVQKNTKSIKANKNKKDSIFMRIKSI